MKSEIPFAPFLIIGMFIAEWFQSDIFHLTSLI
jgi:prepilin signal peptidase PulO-like enzyme (type II secretory pathway)